MEIIGIALLFMLLASSSRLIWNKAALISALLMALSAWWLINRLSGNGIDAATLYHLRTGLRGAGFMAFRSDIAIFVMLLAGSLTPLLVTPVLRKRIQPGSKLIFPAFLACLVICIGTSPIYGDLKRLGEYTSGVDTDAIVPQYQRPAGSPSAQKNILLIYAEGLERTYLNDALFPNLTPNLKRLSTQALDFQDVSSLTGSEWTIAGMTSSMCGLPLTAWDGNDVNSLDRIGRFLPGAYCLGDYLKSENYYLEFVGGAPLEFAGKGKFLMSHGFSTLKDTRYFVSKGYPPDQFAAWGAHDDILLEHVFERFMTLSDAGKPFLLTTLTVDTHHPSGALPTSCADLRHAYEEPMLSAIKCSDRLLANLIDRVRISRHADKTIIVLTSDHIALPNDVTQVLKKADARKNLLFIFDKDNAARAIPTSGSTYDTGSTLLDIMGVRQPQIGFGRSMLGPRVDGASRAFQEGMSLAPYVSYSRSLWQMDRGTSIQLVGSTLDFGAQKVALPVSFTVSPRGTIGDIYLSSRNDRQSMLASRNAARVDRCAAFTRDLEPTEWCLFMHDKEGRPGIFDQRQLTSGMDLSKRPSPDSGAKVHLTQSFIIKQGFQDDFPFALNGKLRGGSVFSSRSAPGLLMNGPYSALNAGSYRLTVLGEADSPSPDAWVDVVSSLGTKAHTRGPLIPKAPQSGIIFEGEFMLEQPASDVEIRINAGPEDRIRIDGYMVLPIGPDRIS